MSEFYPTSPTTSINLANVSQVKIVGTWIELRGIWPGRGPGDEPLGIIEYPVLVAKCNGGTQDYVLIEGHYARRIADAIGMQEQFNEVLSSITRASSDSASNPQ